MTTAANSYPGGHKSNGSTGGAPAPKHPFAHIDDVINVTADCDPHTPMNTLLASAANLLQQAESYRTFGGKLDMALASYIKANQLIYDVMKRNKGWESSQSDNKSQKEKYGALCKRFMDLQRVYEQVKEDIKADNLRTGVQPRRHYAQALRPPHTDIATLTAALSPPKDGNGSVDQANRRDGNPTSGPSPTSARTKPTVRPKPEALHGHALHYGEGVAKTPPKRSADELTARFSKLRATTSPPQKPLQQDPRIKTHPLPIVQPRPTERQGAASALKPSLSIDSLFELPQVPGPIYKPARGTVSTEAAELPSSSSRRFSLARSLTSGSLTSPVVKSPTGGGITEESSDWGKRTKPAIPEGETLPVTELLRLMKEGSKTVSILLIDIRSREAFDEGHIMSQATICIEPEVLMRKDISATEIAESMVLAPSAEQLNFERRHQFDVVVFYDQSSTRIGTKKDDPAEQAVRGLYDALTYFDFPGETNPKPPKLLEGGLDAWTSIMGNNSLATTESSVGQPHRSPKVTRTPMHPPVRRKSSAPKPIQDAAEARRWENATNDPLMYNKDLRDVLRRFPTVANIKESMTSGPAIPASDGSYTSPHSDMPPEPTRPAPSRVRTTHGYEGSSPADSQTATKGLRNGSGGNKQERKPVGLHNPGNLCYANASLQALLYTPDFAEELHEGRWEKQYRVPKKADEQIDNPQLLVKMLSQLFSWMHKGIIRPLEARTLMNYMKHISTTPERRRNNDVAFGDPGKQQDAQEFFGYLIQCLHDETNIRRDQPEPKEAPKPQYSVLHQAIRFWLGHLTWNDSIVSRYWRGIEVSVVTCRREGCGFVSAPTVQIFDSITCPMRSLKGGDLFKFLTDSLRENTEPEHLTDDYECDRCKAKGLGKSPATKVMKYARLPDRLMIILKRNRQDRGEDVKKIGDRLQFPIRDLNMEPYFVKPADRAIDSTDTEVAKKFAEDRQFNPQATYDLYAAMCHQGRTYKSGHYMAYVRNQKSQDPTDWWWCNDATVQAVKVGSGGPEDKVELLYGQGDHQAYVLFYQRRL